MPGPKRSRGGGVAGPEYISLDGLRIDGRRPGEVRRIRCALGTLARADGSAYYEQGNTRVLAAVYGPHEPKNWGKSMHDRATLKCEYSTALFASTTYRKTWKGDRRSVAASLVVQRALEGVVLVENYPKSEIDVYVQVLQDDGGALVAAVNAAMLALVNAGVAMRDMVVACGVGMVDGVLVVDPNAVESGGERPELVMGLLCHAGKVVNCMVERRLPDASAFEKAITIAKAGCQQIFGVLEHQIRNYSLSLLDSRGLVAL